ncbi:MAG TPA: LacI family DNA-binding transcriptional regulator, partial [Symbiobacteriaceae bacterium]|nr:LacI family DNA-binding transcriptional regulator [Symbiobacteriaceae bacterium]
MTTIKDVARAAGVAPSTVSRVLAGSSRISPDTQEKVRAAMKAMNYHPNAIARSLVARATHTVGLVVARPAEQAFANPFFPEVMRGIGSVLYAEGYSLMLSMTATPQEERTACMRMLRQRRVDGVILTSTRLHDQLVDDLIAEEFPVVLIGRVPDHRPLAW